MLQLAYHCPYPSVHPLPREIVLKRALDYVPLLLKTIHWFPIASRIISSLLQKPNMIRCCLLFRLHFPSLPHSHVLHFSHANLLSPARICQVHFHLRAFDLLFLILQCFPLRCSHGNPSHIFQISIQMSEMTCFPTTLGILAIFTFIVLIST